MSQYEEALLRRWSGMRILCASLLVAVLGVAPLGFYILFGPSDGNPIGLGLLAVVAVPVASAGVIVSLIKLAVGRFARENG